jgi:hypothetical protein
MAERKLSSNTGNLEHYLFRARADRGGEIFYRLPRLSALSRIEQAVYCLLGDDCQDSSEKISSLNFQDTDALVERLAGEGLCGYALSSVSRFATGFSDELISRLRRMAATEHQTCLRSAAAFQSALAITASHDGKAVVIKGPAVAATVYSAPHLRHSADLDIVVEAGALPSIFAELESAGFSISRRNSSLCRAGPLTRVEDIFLQPDSDFVACDALPLSTSDGTNLDLKVDPLELGLQMKETERFFADLLRVRIGDHEVCVPDIVDQLLIACCHLHKDNYAGLRLLLDIHLLCRTLPVEGWTELIRRSRVEAVEPMVWASLQLAVERMRSPVPENVLAQLNAGSTALSWQIFYLLNYRFSWNQNSLPSLILNAMVSSNRSRKLSALGRAFFPSAAFLAEYYAEGNERSCYPLLWLFHVLTIASPRRSGKKVSRSISLENTKRPERRLPAGF